MPPASESNSAAKRVDDAKTSLIGWAIGVITSVALLMGGYSIKGTSDLEKKNAVVEEKVLSINRSLDEIKAEQKDARREQIQLARAVDQISNAVGAKKP